MMTFCQSGVKTEIVGSSHQSFLFSFLLCLNIGTTKTNIFEVMLYTGFGRPA